jgi:hypothetical protein
VELFLALGLNTPTYSYAYHAAAVDGLTRLAELISEGIDAATPTHGHADSAPAATRA